MTTTPASATAPADKNNRKRNGLIIGAVTAVIAAALVAGAGYWWWQDHNKLSQASVQDCKLAQRIITEAEQISTGSAADAQKWWEKTGDERRAQMKDGYLGAKISNVEGYALETAENPSAAPSAKELKKLQAEAQGHCSASGVTLSVPRLGS